MKQVIQNFYQTRNLDRQLDRLRTSGKQGVMAAGRVEQIITMLLRYSGAETEELRSKRTKYGELRLKNCRKYDLGSGYRLITMIMESKLFLLCVGTHDECDRWLNNKRGKSLQLEPENFVFVLENGEVEPQQLLEDSWPEEESDEYEEHLLARLSDADLRYIFSGICQR